MNAAAAVAVVVAWGVTALGGSRIVQTNSATPTTFI
jgi:hypothetical protein